MKKVRRIVLGVGYPWFDPWTTDVSLRKFTKDKISSQFEITSSLASKLQKKIFRLVLEEVLDPKEGGGS
jgi:hypothetical protein